jgi:hypothetical protein
LTKDNPDQFDIKANNGKDFNIKVKGHVSKIDVILEWKNSEG